MTVTFTNAEKAAIAAQAKTMLHHGADHESMLLFYREHGFDKLNSIKALAKATSLSQNETRNVVHASRTWQDSPTKDDTKAVVRPPPSETPR